MSQFPLCEQAGLSMIHGPFIRTSEVEALLASAPVVYGSADERPADWTKIKDEKYDTHTARLLLIQPIKVESEEVRLLREMVNFGSVDKSESFYERAKAILAKLDGAK